MLNLNALNDIINEVVIWTENNLLVTENIIDIFVLVFLYFMSLFLFKKYSDDINKILKKIKFISKEQIDTIIRVVLQPLFYILLVWAYILIAEIVGVNHIFSDVVGNLVTAWVIIRLITTFFEEKFYVKILSLLIWSIAALKILNIYEQSLEILDNIAFESGNLRLSLLLIFKGVILFALFFWSANKLNIVIKKRISKTDNLTPSIKVLFTKLSRFLLYTIAFLITLSSIGVSLSAFAFLGGAIGVGLGFGLQKIVSNFISGIIILLDRSIKPGDVVEINDIYGKVKNLDTRFVSVVTLSGKEYLVPNENFITKQVINWSYSDELVRIDVPVGVSYDSDMNLVKSLLLEAVEDKKRVVDNPSPSCLLKEFGDSTVNFELRFWINDPQNGLANIKSEVLFSVWNILNKNDINIAFPQQDLHFESVSDDMLYKIKRAFNNKDENYEKKQSVDEAAVSLDNDNNNN